MAILLKALAENAIKELRANQYKESTIFEYRKTFAQLQRLAEENGAEHYTSNLGELFRNDVISERTGKYSLYRFKRRSRCVQILDWYEKNGCFNLLPFFNCKTEMPRTISFQELWSTYLSHLKKRGIKKNTFEQYRHISCKFLRFLEFSGYDNLKSVPSDMVRDFIVDLRKTWAAGSLRSALSSLRSFLKYTGNQDLYRAATDIRAKRIHKIIPVLSLEEEQSLRAALNTSDAITKRDKAITLISLLTGLRACDIINLKLADIDWDAETVSIIQEKTGVPLCIPLLTPIGNAIASYITYDRPNAAYDNIFISQVAPYKPLASHSACYLSIKRVFTAAGIYVKSNMCGTRLLRHNAASKMLNRGIPIETIASTLGHTAEDSTAVYLTADESRLRECVLPLPAISAGEGVI